MGFQVSRPVGQHAVGGGVGLVERVVRKRHQDVPESLNRVVRIAIGAHSRLERFKLNIELFFFLFSHRSAQQVGRRQGVAREFLGNFHHLLLVHNQAVGFPQNRLEGLCQLGVKRRNGLLAVFSKRVVGV